MNGLVLFLISAVVLLLAYITYGRYLAKKWGIEPERKTPAYEFEDGKDYVPNQPVIVFGHHFTSIAGAGPINGPIIAAMFGWVPVLLWIIFGGIFFGAVQDFVSLYVSVRNKGKTIGYVIELAIGKTGKRLFLLFMWLFSVLVVAAFTDIVALTFNGFAADGSLIQTNASAASTSVVFIVVAVLFGFYLRMRKPKALESSLIAISLLVICIAIGVLFPIYLKQRAWIYIILTYAVLASVTPIWALLAPRDFINTFLLLAIMLSAVIGIVIAAPSVNIPAFNGFKVGNNYLFPILFVTVACGAISGFHSLVASGTVSKQISNEKYMLPVGYGAMLVESLLAVVALICVAAITINGKRPEGVTTPFQIFAFAISSFLSSFNMPPHIVRTFITLGLSAFALTSLDTCARIGRFAIQEFFTDEGTVPSPRVKFLTNKWVATLLTCLFSYALAVVGYSTIWPLFGSANQLLGALALIACAVYLKKTKKQGVMLYFPMIFLLIVTLTALTFNVWGKISKLINGTFIFSVDILQLLFGILLFCLGIMVAVQGINKLRGKEVA